MRIAILGFLLLACVPALAAGQRVQISHFTRQGLKGWDVKSFQGKTRYKLIKMRGNTVLRAHCSDKTASGLFKQIHVDLHETPILHWSWRIRHVYPHLNGKTKSGDDYAGRVYVADYHKFLKWESRAVNYVWANTQPRGSTWTNAFLSQDQMVAVQSGQPAEPGHWVQESRNVLNDMKKFFDRDTINGVALMTDCDNAGRQTTAYYKNIYFSAH